MAEIISEILAEYRAWRMASTARRRPVIKIIPNLALTPHPASNLFGDYCRRGAVIAAGSNGDVLPPPAPEQRQVLVP